MEIVFRNLFIAGLIIIIIIIIYFFVFLIFKIYNKMNIRAESPPPKNFGLDKETSINTSPDNINEDGTLQPDFEYSLKQKYNLTHGNIITINNNVYQINQFGKLEQNKHITALGKSRKSRKSRKSKRRKSRKSKRKKSRKSR
jgi:hypothetical protein